MSAKFARIMDRTGAWRAFRGEGPDFPLGWRVVQWIDGKPYPIPLVFARQVDCEMATRVLNEQQITLRQLRETGDDGARLLCEHLQW